jgi:hypothetical protein
LIGSCRESFEAPITPSNIRLLVVEGYLNVKGKSFFKLSRTRRLGDSRANLPESGAIVSVENDRDQSYILTEEEQGFYYLNLNDEDSKRYKLKIRLADGSLYESAMVKINRDSILSLKKEIKEGTVEIQLNSGGISDVGNYRYEFEETWEFKTLKSEFKWVVVNRLTGDGVVLRREGPEDFIPNICWKSTKSSQIILNSSKNLDSNRILNYPINYLPPNSEKLQKRYSILVRQYALTDSAYVFWEKLRRNTEELGTIFSPQPSEMAGNIKNLSNPNVPVLGYFSSGVVVEKRIFVERQEVPSWVNLNECRDEAVEQPKDYFSSQWIPTQSETVGAPKACVDCRLTGSDVKPSFW